MLKRKCNSINRTANLVPVKSENPSGWPKSDFGNFFLSFSLKAQNYYPAYHIGPDFSNRKRFIIQCYNLLCKGSACFDRRGY